ncbi:hypothetical protein DNFV4_04546 [Nitrospira tepida]|uniref:Uncharacterized protein n=2 Tax=Nitrospira tepida TaxID=2973512 RepID=A0AA86N3Q0_9BACT|nr:hypothetical protein DNFV4_04546 [Nitrospira tepida]
MYARRSEICSIRECGRYDEEIVHGMIEATGYWSLFMKIVCAWCQREGKPGFIREIHPTVDQRVSHGICQAHSEVYHARLRAGLKRVYPVEGQLRSDPAGVG